MDQFGVSWQIAPVDIDDLIKQPGAFERMLTMKKFDIAQLRGD